MADSSDAVPPGAVSLSDAIRSLRDELTSAAVAGEQNLLRFQPGPIELTLEVAVTKSGKASGGVKWWLVDAHGELAKQTVSTQTVKVTLEPIVFDADGQPSHVYIDAPASDRVQGEQRFDPQDTVD
jgi:hypothetical protein